jgi:hypothetical protein
VAGRGRPGRTERPRTRPASVVVPFPRASTADRLELAPFVPSGGSLLVGFAVFGAVLLAIVLARETTLFAVRAIDVSGAGPGVERQVERGLRDRAGESLFGLDLDAARVDIAALPTVASVRQGADSFVVSRRGRVMARADRTVKPDLARIWVTKDVRLDPGAFVEGDLVTAVRAVAPLAGIHFPSRVVSVRTADGLTLRLRSGLELRLGNTREVDLKLAVADRVLRVLPTGSGYLDVSVPDRPVAGPRTLDSPVEVETSTSSGA